MTTPTEVTSVKFPRVKLVVWMSIMVLFALLALMGRSPSASANDEPPRPTPFGGATPERPGVDPSLIPPRPGNGIPANGGSAGLGTIAVQQIASASNGAQIRLKAHTPENFPLWTEVQWQDPTTEEWQPVKTWAGGFDVYVSPLAGDPFTEKLWWVSESDFGTGPFRWVIYDEQNGLPILVSASFNLPTQRGQIVTAEVWFNLPAVVLP